MGEHGQDLVDKPTVQQNNTVGWISTKDNFKIILEYLEPCPIYGELGCHHTFSDRLFN